MENHFHKSCSFCEKSIQSRKNLEKHIHKSHRSCTLCKKTFQKRTNLENHSHKSHSSCTFCKKSFQKRTNLENHFQGIHLEQGSIEKTNAYLCSIEKPMLTYAALKGLNFNAAWLSIELALLNLKKHRKMHHSSLSNKNLGCMQECFVICTGPQRQEFAK